MKAIEGIANREYLRHGNLTKIAKMLKMSVGYVHRISRGERNNHIVELAIKAQIEADKKHWDLCLEVSKEVQEELRLNLKNNNPKSKSYAD